MHNYRRNRRFRMGPRPGDFQLGSWESRAAARAVQLACDLETREHLAAQLQNLTQLEKEFADLHEDPQEKVFAVQIARHIITPKYEFFGMPLPTRDQIRQNAERRSRQRQANQTTTLVGPENTLGDY